MKPCAAAGRTKHPLRLEVTVGSLDPHLRLAPARAELSAHRRSAGGAHAWGLRCHVEGRGATRWNVFLPITVKAYGPAWVLAGNVAFRGRC